MGDAILHAITPKKGRDKNGRVKGILREYFGMVNGEIKRGRGKEKGDTPRDGGNLEEGVGEGEGNLPRELKIR